MIIDAHAHLDLINSDKIEQIIIESKKNDVTNIISCSTSFNSNKINLNLCEKFDIVKCAIGLYPLDLLELNKEEIDKAFDFFEKNISNAIAIGEVGMDFKYTKNESEKEKQKEVFIRFIKLSKKYDKTLIIHSRYATREVIEVLEEQKAKKVMLHSFTESSKLMKRATDNNWFVGVGINILTDELVQQRIIDTPMDKILTETDSPIKFNDKEIYPKDINLIIEKIAKLKNIPIKTVKAQINSNYNTLFV